MFKDEISHVTNIGELEVALKERSECQHPVDKGYMTTQQLYTDSLQKRDHEDVLGVSVCT